jgi:anti-sigma B factor antagonist
MVRPAEFKITRTTTEAGVTFSVTGELDLGTVPVLAESVRRLGGHVKALTLDLSELSFMDSTGLRLLIELDQQARREAWKLTLIRPRHGAAAAVLQATGADSALPFEAAPDR